MTYPSLSIYPSENLYPMESPTPAAFDTQFRGTLGKWYLEETDGVAFDQTIFKQHGEHRGSIVSRPIFAGSRQARYLDGNSDVLLSFPYNILTEETTWSMWFYPDASGTIVSIASGEATTDKITVRYNLDNETLVLSVVQDGQYITTSIPAEQKIHHLAITVSNRVGLYLDGELQETVKLKPELPNGPSFVFVGSNNSSDYITGHVSMLELHNIALSDQDIFDTHNIGSTPPSSYDDVVMSNSPVAYWPGEANNTDGYDDFEDIRLIETSGYIDGDEIVFRHGEKSGSVLETYAPILSSNQAIEFEHIGIYTDIYEDTY